MARYIEHVIIGSTHRTRPPLLSGPPKKPAAKKAGLVQKGLGALAGSAMACVRAPSAFIAGSIVGIYKGAQIGRSADHGVTPKDTTNVMMVASVTAGLMRSGAAGFMAGGPIGAAVGLAQEAVFGGADTYMMIKGGSAREQGTKVFETLNEQIEAGCGTFKGAAKGLSVSGISGGMAAVKTGFGEGNGAVSGIFEGLSEISAEVKEAKPLKGNPLLKMAKAVAGAVSATLAAPAGLVFGVMEGASSSLLELDVEPKKPVSPVKRKLIAAAATAGAGVAAGFLVGPLGMAVGGVVGGIAGLLGPGKEESFQKEIGKSIQRARLDDVDTGNPVGEKYRDILQNVVVGGLAGMRQGWDKAVS